MKRLSIETLSIVLGVAQINGVFPLLPFLVAGPLPSFRGQPVKPVRLVLNLDVRVFVLDVNAKVAVEYFVELAEFRAIFGILAPAVQHLVIAAQRGKRKVKGIITRSLHKGLSDNCIADSSNKGHFNTEHTSKLY